jgi:tRNA-2-methylthio-N6-dimethylallyladenosine synthase
MSLKKPKSEATIREHLLNGNGKKSVTAFVSIMQGCNQYCTFCIVPYTRGEERSRSIPDILAECRELVGRGVKEITFLGQIVTSYGKRDIPVRNGVSAFVQLLEAAHELEGLERIRFTSPHPKGYGDDLVAAYGRLTKLVESAHLPVQSGSDRVLKLMHRGYTRERYMEVIRKLRQVRPEIGLSTDFIVGFPWRNRSRFRRDLRPRRGRLNSIKHTSSGIPKGAIRRQRQCPIKFRKSFGNSATNACWPWSTRLPAGRYQALVGRRVEILVEGPSKRNAQRLTGRTRCNKIVVFNGVERHRSQVMELQVSRAGSFTLYGDPAIVNLDE